MDLAAVRSLVREVNFEVHGVAAVVTIPDGTPVATRVIWLTPIDAENPGGELRRSEPQRRLAVRRDDVPSLPRGSRIEVTEHLLDDPDEWVVDSRDASRSDHHRVVVVPAPESFP